MLNKIIRRGKGFTLIELLVVISIIGVLAAIGIPEYGRHIAKSRSRRAATDLLQNMRLARTMAIKENRNYLMIFNGGVPSNYKIGFDGDSNGSLNDVVDEYGTGNVKQIDIQGEYGSNVVLGSSNFIFNPPNGPNGIAINDAVSFQFFPDGSSIPNGTVYIQHTRQGYTDCVELANASGKINLYAWQGRAGDSSNPLWTELR